MRIINDFKEKIIDWYRYHFWSWEKYSYVSSQEHWEENNAEKEKNPVCTCGKVGVQKIYIPQPMNGGVLTFIWRCTDHQDVSPNAIWHKENDKLVPVNN